jgi:hypothetical protein
MNVRPFDWRDLTALYRYRHQSVYLDSALVLTRGSKLVSGALLSYFALPMGIFTSVINSNSHREPEVIGQVIHLAGAPYAHLTFLTPQEALESGSLAPLLEYQAAISGVRGALRLLADVDEHSGALEALHLNGFAIYSRQRIWQLTGQPLGGDSPGALRDAWDSVTSQDVNAIRSLYNNLVPALVQQVEPFDPQRSHGMVLRKNGEVVAFVEIRSGPRGIWVQPFVHPDEEQVRERFIDLILNLPNRRSRPVYLCVRSYQSWLETAVEELGAEAGPRQALMVKHLAVAQKSARAFALPALEGGHPEISAPITRAHTYQAQSGKTSESK